MSRAEGRFEPTMLIRPLTGRPERLRRPLARCATPCWRCRSRCTTPARPAFPPVKGSDFRNCQAFGCRDYGRIDGPEREVAVGPHQVGDSKPVSCPHGLDSERSTCKVSQEADLRLCAKPRRDEIGAEAEVRFLGDLA